MEVSCEPVEGQAPRVLFRFSSIGAKRCGEGSADASPKQGELLRDLFGQKSVLRRSKMATLLLGYLFLVVVNMMYVS